jgi:hypothetical protein
MILPVFFAEIFVFFANVTLPCVRLILDCEASITALVWEYGSRDMLDDVITKMISPLEAGDFERIYPTILEELHQKAVDLGMDLIAEDLDYVHRRAELAIELSGRRKNNKSGT